MSDSENKESSQTIELDFDFSFHEEEGVSTVFLKEADEILSDLDEAILRLEAHAHDEVLLQGLFRKVHTLKGSVGAVPGGQLLGSLAHEFETLLDRLRKQKITPTKECIEIFLHSSRLLKILAENLRLHRDLYPEELSEVIELIARYGSFQLNTSTEPSLTSEKSLIEDIEETEPLHNQDGVWLSKEQMSFLLQLSSDFILLKNLFQSLTGSKYTQAFQMEQEKQNSFSQSLNSISEKFQGFLDKVQKISLKEAFSGLSPLIRQTAYELKKEVVFKDLGFEIEIDKVLAADLRKALMHMVRNSLDHGIEAPEVRVQAGKSPQGTLQIKVEERASIIHCEISDDGKGIDKNRILQRALKKGLTNVIEASQLSEDKIFSFIFNPGFSTKEKITTISGRGVGMDVVQGIVNKYGGHIEVESKIGEGSKIHLIIPMPRKMLIERCLLGEWKNFSFAFPLSEISHIQSCDELQMTEIEGLRFCQFNHQTVPLLTLEEIYELKTKVEIHQVKDMAVVFLNSSNLYLGVLVDKIQHQADLVIKSFGNFIEHQPGFKGASVIAEDQISYVMDVTELERLLQRKKV
ncbi:MAG: chemotaxis protein CheA [Pseudobdellovibrionaceae bacterium]